MLAGLDSRQLSEMYAFASIEPLDEPLQRMFAQLTDVLARVNGNQTSESDFMLVRPPVAAIDDSKLRAQQIAEMFAAAAKRNQ